MPSFRRNVLSERPCEREVETPECTQFASANEHPGFDGTLRVEQFFLSDMAPRAALTLTLALGSILQITIEIAQGSRPILVANYPYCWLLNLLLPLEIMPRFPPCSGHRSAKANARLNKARTTHKARAVTTKSVSLRERDAASILNTVSLLPVLITHNCSLSVHLSVYCPSFSEAEPPRFGFRISASFGAGPYPGLRPSTGPFVCFCSNPSLPIGSPPTAGPVVYLCSNSATIPFGSPHTVQLDDFHPCSISRSSFAAPFCNSSPPLRAPLFPTSSSRPACLFGRASRELRAPTASHHTRDPSSSCESATSHHAGSSSSPCRLDDSQRVATTPLDSGRFQAH